MNAPKQSPSAKSRFVWQDPLLIDSQLTEQERMVRDAAEAYARDKLAPRVQEAFRNEKYETADIYREMGELGLLGVRYPEADGGTGLDKISDCIVREELSYMSQGFASSWSAHSHLGIWPIWKAGTEQQRRRFFQPAGPEGRGRGFQRMRFHRGNLSLPKP